MKLIFMVSAEKHSQVSMLKKELSAQAVTNSGLDGEQWFTLICKIVPAMIDSAGAIIAAVISKKKDASKTDKQTQARIQLEHSDESVPIPPGTSKEEIIEILEAGAERERLM